MSNVGQELSIGVQNELTGVRTRFQRMTDCKFFTGWVQDFSGQRILVLSSPEVVLTTGQEFQFEVFGRETIASFQARLEFGSDSGFCSLNATVSESIMKKRVLAAADFEFDFAISSAVKQRKATEEARQLIKVLEAHIVSELAKIEGTVVDTSDSGMAIVLSEKLQIGRRFDVCVETRLGQVQCEAVVRYSRANRQVPNNFRTGFQIESIDRVNRARWNQIQ